MKAPNNLTQPFYWLLLCISLLTLTACAPRVDANLARAANINAQLVYAYLEEKHPQRAKDKVMLALTQAPRAPNVLAAAGYYYAQTGQNKLASRYYTQAIQAAPTNGEYLNNYAVFLCETKHYKQAIRYFKRAAEIPNYANAQQAHRNAVLCYKSIKQPQ